MSARRAAARKKYPREVRRAAATADNEAGMQILRDWLELLVIQHADAYHAYKLEKLNKETRVGIALLWFPDVAGVARAGHTEMYIRKIVRRARDKAARAVLAAYDKERMRCGNH